MKHESQQKFMTEKTNLTQQSFQKFETTCSLMIFQMVQKKKYYIYRYLGPNLKNNSFL